MEILKSIRQAPMSAFQVRATVVAIAILIMDGLDITVIAFAAPAMSREWDIAPTELGIVLSGSLIGMAIGSMLLAPLADRFGRRRVILTALGVMTVGMGLTVFADSPPELLAYRVITGLGAGAMIANIIVVVSEYASDKRRSMLTAIQAAGYPIGSALAGVVAGPMIPAFGWQSVFLFGAVASLLLLLLGFKLLPESLDYLLTRQPRNALEQTNTILTRMGRPTLDALPTPEMSIQAGGSTAREVLRGSGLFRSVLLWLGYGLLISGFYFVNTWTPKIIADAADDESLGVTIGIVANIGGIVGCFLFAALMTRFVPGPSLVGTLVASAAGFVAFSFVFDKPTSAFVVALLLGMLTTGGIAGFQAFGPHVYSPQARATGLGLMIWLGRVVAIVSPILVGSLLQSDWQPEQVYLLFGLPMVAAAVCVYATYASLRRAQKAASQATVGPA